MADGERTRVVTRHDPITTVIETGSESLTFVAFPIPFWRARNDLGNLMVAAYANAMNVFLHGYTSKETDEFLLVGESFEHAMPYDDLFDRCYGSYEDYSKEHPEPKPASAEYKTAFEKLDYPGMIAVLEAGLEVNGLESQIYMLDNRKNALSQPTSLASLNDDAGQKMESSAASG